MIDVDAKSVLALVVAILGATLIAFVLYRRTSPTLPLRLRIALGILRWLAAFLVLAMVTDPALRLVRTRSATPVIGVLIDDSRSMAYPDPQAKIAQMKSSLSDAFIDALGRKAQLRFFTFSDTSGQAPVDRIRDSAPRGSRTDLAAGITSAMKSLGGKPSALILLSDGGVNFGEDPLRFCSSLKVPVYAISVAGREPTPDLSVDKLEVSEVAYAGSQVPVVVHLGGRHQGPVESTLTLTDSTGRVFSSPVTIAGDGSRQKIVANIDAGGTGTHAFTATLAPFEGEQVVSNNSMAFSVKVIKGKIRVTLVAPHPSWDFAFASRSLESDPSIDLSVVFSPGSVTAVKLGRVTNDIGRAISDCDVAVVLGDAALGPAAKGLEQIVWKGGAVLLVSPASSLAGVGAMNPFVVTRTSGQLPHAQLVSPAVAEAGTGHEILDTDVARGGLLWSSLPPIPVDDAITGAKQDATVLISGVGQGREGAEKGAAHAEGIGQSRGVPLLVVMRYGLGRVVGFAGRDLWRWDLVPRGFGSDASAFSELLISSIRWLVEGEKVKRLALSTTKSDYLWGEPIPILARVVDESLKPVAGATVETQLINGASGKAALAQAMIERSTGSHSEIVDLLGPGRYTVKAAAKLDGRVYAEDAVSFTVSERGLEDSNFDGDVALLDEIALATGGRVYAAPEAALLAESLNPASVIVKGYHDLRFRLTVASFAVLAALFGAEWLVRRRKMLA